MNAVQNYFVWICVTHFVFYCNTQSRKINSEWIMMKASYYNLVLSAYDNNNYVGKKTFHAVMKIATQDIN